MPLSAICSEMTLLKDAVLTLAAIVGMIVAWYGLKTWNRQLKGSIEYELTRRLLKCTYRLREAIKSVRHPIMWNSEMPAPPENESEGMTREQQRYYGMSRAYQLRWEKVALVRNDLQTELLEAEVIWGKTIYDKFAPLFKLQQDLFAEIHAYLIISNPAERPEARDAMAEITRRRREIMYDTSDPLPDEYSIEVNSAIAAIEAFLQPHLRK